MSSRFRSPVSLILLCLQLVLALRVPAAVSAASTPDRSAPLIAVGLAEVRAHHDRHDHDGHGLEHAAAQSAEDGHTPDHRSHDEHTESGCHGGLPCCAATLLATGVRHVVALPRLVSACGTLASDRHLADDRVVRRQPPSTAPPTLG